MNPQPKKPNKTDSWISPFHAKMAQGMRRYKHGLRGPDGLFIYLPGERIMPEPECLRHQRWAEQRKKVLAGA